MCFLDDWRADGYRWRQVGAAKAMRSSSTDLQKFYFQVYNVNVYIRIRNF